MAQQQTVNQEMDQDSNLDDTASRNQDDTVSRNHDITPGMVNGTDMPCIIDPPRYTAAVQKVLSHNLKVAQQDVSFAALPSPNISTEVEINPIFTVLQRPLDFEFEWEKRPLLNLAGGSNPLRIIPSTNLPLPESTVGAPMLAYWRLNYSIKTQATITRFGKTSIDQPLEQALGIRDVATLMYTDPITSGSTPSIRFQPHENEIIRRGASNVQVSNNLMSLTRDRWGSTKYVVDLPEALGGLTVMWVFGHVEGFADGRLLADRQSEEDVALTEIRNYHANRAASLRPASASSTDMGDAPSKPPLRSSWAIYPVQRLVDADTGRILATYTRNAPLSKTAGTLMIFPKLVAGQAYPYECLSAELIEGIIIVTAAMVDVQQRIGMVSGLLEAGAESMRWMEEPPHPLRSDP